MNPWFDTWLNMFRAPLSGDVSQDYRPVTSWWSPQLEFNFAGDQKVEAEVVRSVASYGKQLGILTEAVLALAKDSNSPEVARLQQLAEEVGAVKKRRSSESAISLKQRLQELRDQDPEEFKRLLAEVSTDH